jgi:hypothetical protein
MALNKPMRLVKALFDKTQKGEIDWQEGFGRDTFQVSFKDNTVQISTADGRQGGLDYVIQVLNEEGTVVDRFIDEELDNDEGGPPGGSWFRMMKELHNMAMRHARGADKALSAILNEIEDDIPF